MKLVYSLIISLVFATSTGFAQEHFDEVKLKTKNEVNRIINPLLSRYCEDHCKLLNTIVEIKPVEAETFAPGFEDFTPMGPKQVEPASVKVKLLINEMLGPVSRRKLIDLIYQHFESLTYPVVIDEKVTRFPQSPLSARKVAEIRSRVEKKFKATIKEIFDKFCPQQCLLGDFELKVDPVNTEEAQYGASGEFVQEGDTAVRIRNITATLLLDDTLTIDEQNNVLDMAKLRTNFFKNVEINTKVMRFPHPEPFMSGYGGPYGRFGRGLAEESSTNSTNELKDTKNLTETQTKTDSKTSTNNLELNKVQNNSNESKSKREERYERFEKIERVEDGDAVQKELNKFKLYGAIFAASVFAFLIFIALGIFRKEKLSNMPIINKFFDPNEDRLPGATPKSSKKIGSKIALKVAIQDLKDELSKIFAEQPKVAKQVFSRVLTEEGIETTSQYIEIFGDAIVLDLLRDPSLQRDLNELMEFYAKNIIELEDEETYELLRALHNRTVAAKMLVMGNRSSNLFEYLAEMDAQQIMELIRNESITVKAIVLTQIDNQKRNNIFSQVPEKFKMKLLQELSRIDHLPKDYIYNVANALKRKRRENPRLNTDVLPGSEVLVGLLEKTNYESQKTIITSLEIENPDSARSVKGKLVSLDTLRYLRDSQLLEVILSLKHNELLQFLRTTPERIRNIIMERAPRELADDLREEVVLVKELTKEGYQSVERKIINKIRTLANDGHLNLAETNERMFGDKAGNVVSMDQYAGQSESIQTDEKDENSKKSIRKVAGW